MTNEYEIARNVEPLREAVEAGEGRAALIALRFCLMLDEKPPEWLRRYLVNAISARESSDATSLDEAFNWPAITSKSAGKLRKIAHWSGYIWLRMQALAEEQRNERGWTQRERAELIAEEINRFAPGDLRVNRTLVEEAYAIRNHELREIPGK